MTLRSAGRLLTAVGVIAFGVVGCMGGVVEDTRLQPKLEKLVGKPASTRLADLATFDWDTVYVFDGYTTKEEVDSTVGGKVPMYLTGWVPESERLIVFDLNGKPVRYAYIPSRLLSPADRDLIGHGFSHDAVIDSCPWPLLHEPGQNAGLNEC